MSTVLKSVKVSKNHSAFLYDSGAVILKMEGSKLGTLVDRELSDAIGSPELAKLVTDGEVLRAPKQSKAAKTSVKVDSSDHRMDLMQAHLDSMAKTQAATLQMLQQMLQSKPTILNMAE